MKTQVRILLVAALFALLAGWVSLRRGNAALSAQLAGVAGRAQGQPDEAAPERAGGPGGREPKASVPPERMEHPR